MFFCSWLHFTSIVHFQFTNVCFCNMSSFITVKYFIYNINFIWIFHWVLIICKLYLQYLQMVITQSGITKHRLNSIQDRNLFSLVLEADKSKIERIVWLMTGEGSHPGLQVTSIPCILIQPCCLSLPFILRTHWSHCEGPMPLASPYSNTITLWVKLQHEFWEDTI